MKEIINGLSGKVDSLYAEGLHVGGERYVLTKAEDRSLYARKVCYSPISVSAALKEQICATAEVGPRANTPPPRVERASLSSRLSKPSSLPTTARP